MIPFVPFPLSKAIKEAKIFERAGAVIAKTKPSLKLDLFQAEIPLHPKVYASIVALTTTFYFFVMTPIIFLVGLIARGKPDFLLPIAIGGVFSLFVFSYLMRYPKFVAIRRIKKLEKDLLNALQHILIEIKSGVPLFNAMIGVTEGYGEVSEEFKIIVKEINAGIAEIKALERASLRNPSLHFRRSLWQITNAMKAGSDVASALEAIVDTLTQEQIIAIRRYGQELSPFTLMYMLIAVIMPTLGITFLIILSSFAGLKIPEFLFPLIILVLAMFQYFYMGIIKTKRPALVTQ
ncbi:MAG: type II secretion system F family protein [Candidatus Aenigmatarchaeota archaeon]